jgi:hypothetical protein
MILASVGPERKPFKALLILDGWTLRTFEKWDLHPTCRDISEVIVPISARNFPSFWSLFISHLFKKMVSLMCYKKHTLGYVNPQNEQEK